MVDRTPVIDTLFFDLDGTLTDNHAGISGCIVHALARMNLPAPTAAVLSDCNGPPLRQTFGRLLSTADGSRIEQAIAFYRERFDSTGWQENAPYPQIDVALSKLAGSFRLFVCTAKPQRYADRIIDHFGLRQYFLAVYGPDLDGRLDDKRQLLRHALASEAVLASRALMIGDRAQDMLAAASNNSGSLGVLYGYGSPAELSAAGADALCASVDALPSAVARWPGRKIDRSS